MILPFDTNIVTVLSFDDLLIESEFLYLDSYNCFLKRHDIPFQEWNDMNIELVDMMKRLSLINNSRIENDIVMLEKSKIYNACSVLIYEFLNYF